MSDGAGGAVVQRARDAAGRGDWQEAFDLLMKQDADGLLGPADLPVLGEVAYAAGELDVAIEAWERAHATCMRGGDEVAAAGAAVRVAMHLLFDTALMAPVRGWLARAERLLEGQDQTPAHAWYAVVRTYERMLTGDLDSARGSARRAIEVGSKCDPAACAIGRVAEARLLILNGDVRQGLALLNDAGVATVSGDLDALSTGLVYCELVCALQGLAQYDVAEEWTEAMERWSKMSAVGSLHGRCRVHRAEILRLRGSWDEAETEALAACEELRPYLRREMGWPLSELGRIRLRKGDLEARSRPCWPLIVPGGIPSRVSRWCGWPEETSPRRPPRYETRSSAPCGCHRRSCHRTPICGGRRCSRRRSRSRSRPATSTEHAQPPTKCSAWPPASTARR